MPINIVHQDITKIRCDAIVDPTNPFFSAGGGADLAIHLAAGKELDEECEKLDRLHTGTAVVTKAYALPCKHIIHTVGPVWHGGNHNEAALLRSCYLNSLILAYEIGAKTIAMPLISAGTFHFPKRDVLKIALTAIEQFLQISRRELTVSLTVIDSDLYEVEYEEELQKYLVKNGSTNGREADLPHALEESANTSLADYLKGTDDSFAVLLFKWIDRKGMKDVDCYKKANVSRKTFYKIKNMPYKPSKATVLAFCIALELTLEETERLLKTAGFALSASNRFDRIIEFYIRHNIYNIFEINATLDKYKQPILFS